jgi:hypothetical protein
MSTPSERSSCAGFVQEAKLFGEVPADSAYCVYSANRAYRLVVNPHTVGNGHYLHDCILVDSSGNQLWRKEIMPWSAPYCVQVSNLGMVAVLSGPSAQIFRTLVVTDPKRASETGPAAICAEFYDRQGREIYDWFSHGFPHESRTIRYIKDIAFHPTLNLLVVTVWNTGESWFKSGQCAYGVFPEEKREWCEQLGPDLRPKEINFHGNDITITCARPDFAPDSLLVLTPNGEPVPH